MTSRESVLKALEEALKNAPAGSLPPLPSGRETYADYPEDDLPGLFLRNLFALRGEGSVGETMDELGRSLGNVLSTLDPGTIFAQDHPFLRAIVQRLPQALSREVTHRADWRLSNDEMSQAVAAITLADAFIARTGSVALRSSISGGRRLSVLPPVHIAVGTTSQVAASLEDWIASVQDDASWSFGTIISGPSRTGDIEKILVLGAHGPKRLVVLLLNDLRRDSFASGGAAAAGASSGTRSRKL